MCAVSPVRASTRISARTHWPPPCGKKALCVDGVHVVHILGAGQETVHPMTGPARIVDGRLTYQS